MPEDNTKRDKPASKQLTQVEIDDLFEAVGPRPDTPDQLHAWLNKHLNVTIARTPLIDDHQAPFDYLCHTYFEAEPSDCALWANRGGGKTFLGAVATLLDLLWKPRIQVRILGGSLEQSLRMHEHLTTFFALDAFRPLVIGKPTIKRITLINKSRVEVLAASQTSVRGTRVQKIRCDEVDLFDRETWDAAQLTTRSMKCKGPWGETVRGSVEALSTMHRPYGLMWELVGARLFGVPEDAHARRKSAASQTPRRVFRWGVVDVLEKCGPEHECSTCALAKDCKGKAKSPAHAGGHIAVADAQVMKSRVDWATWSAEMLCNRPRRTDSVYPEFDIDAHVFNESKAPALTFDPQGHAYLAGDPVRLIAGMDFGIRSEGVVLGACVDSRGVIRIEWEHAARGRRLSQHIDAIKDWLQSLHSAAHLNFLAIDPAGYSRNEQTGEANAKFLTDAGFKVRGRRGGVELGIQLVRTRLAPATWGKDDPDAVQLTLDGNALPTGASPTLFIHARCTRLIECVQRYHYPPNRPDATEPDKTGGFDHACDALRYMVLNLDRPGTLKALRHESHHGIAVRRTARE